MDFVPFGALIIAALLVELLELLELLAAVVLFAEKSIDLTSRPDESICMTESHFCI